MGLLRGMGPRVVLAVAALHLVACATMGDPPPTLYKRLGGREGSALVVGDFVTNMAGASRVTPSAVVRGPSVWPVVDTSSQPTTSG